MKRNPLLEELRKTTPPEVKREIDLSFDIADRIHEILVKQNKTHRDLALMLGKSEAEISKWMRGTHNFTFQTITKIETVLGEPLIEVTGRPKKTDCIFVQIPYMEKMIVFSKECSAKVISTSGNINMPFPVNESFKSNEIYN